MRIGRLFLVVGCVSVPMGTSGQESGFASQLDEVTRAAVQSTLEEAAGDSLPIRTLQSKVLEGLAKNVPPARIGQVLAALARELREARAALRSELPGVTFDDGEIVAAAAALRQGIGRDAVLTLWEARPDQRSLEIPVTILSELVRRGIPVAEASVLVAHVVRTSVALQVAAQIPGKFDGALSAGAPPNGALAEALRVLDIPGPPDRPGRPPNR
jgi:hypothetical protein